MAGSSIPQAALIAVCLLAISAFAEAVHLAWDANPPEDEVQAYYVHQSTNVAGPYLVVTNSATNAIRVWVPKADQYFWYVTASNFWSVSEPSNIANTPTVASNVTTLKIQR